MARAKAKNEFYIICNHDLWDEVRYKSVKEAKAKVEEYMGDGFPSDKAGWLIVQVVATGKARTNVVWE